MLKTKDGYAKLVGTSYNGNANYLLKSDGGVWQAGNANGNIPISNGATNTNLNADLLDGIHATGFVKTTNSCRISQYNSGTWHRFLTFTISSGTLLPSISFIWHPTECQRGIYSIFNINIRSNDIIFMETRLGTDSRTLKCTGDGTTFYVWVKGTKGSYDPYGCIQHLHSFALQSYLYYSLTGATDSEPSGTYNKIASLTGLVSYSSNSDMLDGQHGSYYATAASLGNYLPLAGGWMNTDALIYFRGKNSSTSAYGRIGYSATSISGLKMHLGSDTYNTKALYIQSNGYDGANDTGGIAIDNDGVTAFGAGDTGSVFRVLNEDAVTDGALFYVTKGSGANVKYKFDARSLGVTNTDSATGRGLSLYGGASDGAPTYGMMFAGTGTFGAHGYVGGSDWATYLTMSDTTTRGWIFRRGSTNVASINGSGNMFVNRIMLTHNSNLTSAYHWTNAALTAPTIEILNYYGTTESMYPTLTLHHYGYGGPRLGSRQGVLTIYGGNTDARTLGSRNSYFKSMKIYPNEFDGLYVNDIKVLLAFRRINLNITSSDSGMIPPSILEFKNGYPLHTDPEFNSGNNGINVYNNAGDGKVTITRQADDLGSGNSSGYILKVTSTGPGSPGVGGWYFGDGTVRGREYTCIFRAKIPSGFNVLFASNSIGSNGNSGWLTQRTGTGKWEWYAYHVECGTASFSSTNFFYIEGSSAVTWYLSYANTIINSWGRYDGLRTRYSDNTDYATYASNYVMTYHHTSNNTNYPIIWSNSLATTSRYSQLHTSYAHLYYNPANLRLTSGRMFIGTDHTAISLDAPLQIRNNSDYFIVTTRSSVRTWGQRIDGSGNFSIRDIDGSATKFLIDTSANSWFATHISPWSNNGYNLGRSDYEWSSAYIRYVNTRHIDASGNYTGDHNLYIGYGAVAKTDNIYFYRSNTTDRTHMFTINSAGAELVNGNFKLGDGTHTFLYRTSTNLESGFYFHTSGRESVVFANQYAHTGWIFANGIKPTDRKAWNALGVTPAMQIHHNAVYINRAVRDADTADYNLYVGGTIYNTNRIYAALSYKTWSASPTYNNTKLHFGYHTHDHSTSQTMYLPWFGGSEAVNGYGYGNSWTAGLFQNGNDTTANDVGFYLGTAWDSNATTAYVWRWTRLGYTYVPSYLNINIGNDSFTPTHVYCSYDTWVRRRNFSDFASDLLSNFGVTKTTRSSYNSSNTKLESVTGYKFRNKGFIELWGFSPEAMYRTDEDRPGPYGIGFTDGYDSGGIMPIGNSNHLAEIMFYGANSGPTVFTWKYQVWESTSYLSNYSNRYSDAAMSLNSLTGLLYVKGNVGLGTTSPGYKLDIRGTTRSTGRIYANEWILFDNYTGLYSPKNGAHFYPNNTTTYGLWKILGSKGGYSGILLGDSNSYMTLMDNSNDKGFYLESNGTWIYYYYRPDNRVGIRTSSNWGGNINILGNTHILGSWLRVRTNGSRIRSETNSSPDSYYMEFGANYDWTWPWTMNAYGGVIMRGHNGTSHLSIAPSGQYVGIGIDAPVSKLLIEGTTYSNLGGSSKPSFRWNKSGTYWGGIGYNGTTNVNEFGPATNSDTWANVDTSDTWRFRGILQSTRQLNSNDYRFNNYLAYYNTSTSTITGIFEITLPNGWNSTMMAIEIDVYEYDSTHSHSKIIIGGYNYGGKYWTNYRTSVLGNYDKAIRLAYNNSSGKCCILLGATNSSWSYPLIWITSVKTGYNALTSWISGYSITGSITSEANYTAIVTPSRTDVLYSTYSYYTQVDWSDSNSTWYLAISPGSGQLRLRISAIYANPAYDSIGINTTTNMSSYKLNVGGDSWVSGWSRAGGGFYCENTGVHFTHLGSIGEIDVLSNNEFLWGSSASTLYFNYRGVSRGTTVTNYVWNAGSSSSWAQHTLGKLFLHLGDATLKFYSGVTTDGYNDGAIAMQTCIDGHDGETNYYASSLPAREAIYLQPRGGYVRVGYNLLSASTAVNGAYRPGLLAVNGNIQFGTNIYHTSTGAQRFQFLGADGSAARTSHRSIWIGTSYTNSDGDHYIYGNAGRIFFGGNFHIDSLGSNSTYINYYTTNTIRLANGDRLDIDSTGRVYPNSTAKRRSGMYGVYDSYKIGHIWSMGTSYMIPDDGSSFGNLYGLAYTYHNRVYTSTTMGGGHLAVWCVNGTPLSAMGDYVWSRNGFLKEGSSNSYVLLGGGGHKALSDFSMNGHTHDGRYLRYSGWWSSGSGQSLDNANGMIFAYSNHGHPGTWGIVTTFDYSIDSSYRLLLAGDGYNNELWFRNRSADRGGWYTGWAKIRHSRDTYMASDGTYRGFIGGSEIQSTRYLLINGVTWTGSFHWSGLSGLPSWLWGSNNGSTMYIWNPSNFHVWAADLLYPINSNPNNSHTPGYGLRVWYSWDQGQANNASSGYCNGLTIGSHPSNTGYGWQICQNMWNDRTYTRRYNGGWQTWLALRDSGDTYVSTYGVIGGLEIPCIRHLLINGVTWWSNWTWSGQSGQPNWLWGSNDGTNMYVWNPSNFTVNRARAIYYSGTGTNEVTAYLTSDSYFGRSGWATYIIGNHGNGASYYHQIIAMPFWGMPQYQRMEGGSNTSWYTFAMMGYANSGKLYADSFYENSDIRYKRIIKYLNIETKQISELPIFDFEWTLEQSNLRTGTSAQEVLKILPYLVNDIDNRLTLDYGALGTISGIAACREIEKLKEKILYLESKLKELEKIDLGL